MRRVVRINANVLAAMAEWDEEPVALTFAVPRRLRFALDALATELDISRAELLRRAVRDLLAAHRAEPPSQ
jgi:hypothetical protein